MKKSRHRPDLPGIDKTKCKCLADLVLLYIRYACPKLAGIDQLKQFQDCAELIYQECVRGDIIGDPRTKAAGVLYCAAILTTTYVSQTDIAVTLIVNEVTIRTAYLKIKPLILKNKTLAKYLQLNSNEITTRLQPIPYHHIY